MRIAFIGAVDFSRHCLDQVVAAGGQVVGVFAPLPEAARFNADYVDLLDAARRHAIPGHHFARINAPETVAALRALEPDILFVFGLSQLLGPDLLTLAPLGVIGSHPSLLPRGRGRHPLVWALVEGLEESGLSFFYMDEGADSGDLLWQKSFPITLDDDAASLYAKIKVLAAEGIAEFVPALCAGRAARRPQDTALATYWRKRDKRDGEIRWGGRSLDAYNLIRALTRPYVGAHTFLDGHEMQVWRAMPAESFAADGEPGLILDCSDGTLLVRTGDGALRLIDWSIAEAGGHPAPGLILGAAP